MDVGRAEFRRVRQRRGRFREVEVQERLQRVVLGGGPYASSSSVVGCGGTGCVASSSCRRCTCTGRGRVCGMFPAARSAGSLAMMSTALLSSCSAFLARAARVRFVSGSSRGRVSPAPGRSFLCRSPGCFLLLCEFLWRRRFLVWLRVGGGGGGSGSRLLLSRRRHGCGVGARLAALEGRSARPLHAHSSPRSLKGKTRTSLVTFSTFGSLAPLRFSLSLGLSICLPAR